MLPLIPVALAFLLGVGAGRALDQPVALWAWVLLWPFALLSLRWRDLPARRALLIVLAFLLGALRYAWAVQPPDAAALVHWNDRERVTLSGIVEEHPDER